MADKIPAYVKKNIDKIHNRLGICICCDHIQEPTKNQDGSELWCMAFCKKTKLQCYVTRESLVSCKFFKERKGKPASESLKKLLKAMAKSLKRNDWAPLKEAIDDELQN